VCILKCIKCLNDFSEEYLECPFCGTLSRTKMGQNNIINAGTNNVNIGLGVESKQEIYMDNVNVNMNVPELEKKKEQIVEYEDRLDGEIIGGIQGYQKRYEISGIISIVSGVVTLGSYLFGSGDYIAFLAMATGGLILFALDSKGKQSELMKEGVFYKNGSPVLCEQEGKVYRVRKYGICPVCQGRVNIYYDQKNDRKLGQCVNNKDHLYTYDHTINKGFPLNAHIYNR